MSKWYMVAKRLGFEAGLGARLCDLLKEHDLVHDVTELLVQSATLTLRSNPRLPFTCAIGVPVRGSAQDAAETSAPRVFQLLSEGAGLQVYPRLWSRDDVAREFRAHTGFADLKHSLGSTVPAEEPVVAEEENPFEQEMEIAAHVSDVARTAQFDRLLAWLSAVGRGSFGRLSEACAELRLASSTAEVRAVRRRLVLLGHLQVSEDGAGWQVRESVLIPLAGEGDSLLWCGQRVPSVLNRWVRELGAIVEPQPGGDGPSRVTLKGVSSSDPAIQSGSGGAQVHVLDQPQAVECVPIWRDWLESLERIEPPIPSQTRVEACDANGTYHDVRQQVFDSDGRVVLPSGLYRLGSTSDRYGTPCLFDATAPRWCKGDWYGLRFASRRLNGEETSVTFSPSRLVLRVPRGWEWPLVYEATLVQSTGLLPLVDSAGRQFEQVSAASVSAVCERLGVALHVMETAGANVCETC